MCVCDADFLNRRRWRRASSCFNPLQRNNHQYKPPRVTSLSAQQQQHLHSFPSSLPLSSKCFCCCCVTLFYVNVYLYGYGFIRAIYFNMHAHTNWSSRARCGWWCCCCWASRAARSILDVFVGARVPESKKEEHTIMEQPEQRTHKHTYTQKINSFVGAKRLCGSHGEVVIVSRLCSLCKRDDDDSTVRSSFSRCVY